MERKAVIFDFDNTLYNWMDAFAPSFIEQVNYISSETNLEVGISITNNLNIVIFQKSI